MAAPRPTTIVVDVSVLDGDALTIEWLARLALGARRRGQRIQLRDASHELRELLTFVGLDGALGLEPRWETEEREQARGVEEEREL